VEFALLRRALNRRIGRTGLPLAYSLRLWGAAAAAAAVAWAVKLAWPGGAPAVLGAVATLAAFAAGYGAAAVAARVPIATRLWGRVRRRGRAAG
jgi:putative peptidoglycan lipid II flippase